MVYYKNIKLNLYKYSPNLLIFDTVIPIFWSYRYFLSTVSILLFNKSIIFIIPLLLLNIISYFVDYNIQALLPYSHLI